MSILAEIIANKREEVSFRKLARPLPGILAQLHRAAPPRDFRVALSDPSRRAPRVIAEIKRRSPSKGALRPDLDPAQVASVYQRNGAAALSVLADGRYFGGSMDDLSVVSMWTSLPVLCKEFVVDAYQVYEARLAGADAVLLLASVLDVEQLRAFREIAESLGMSALVEVHSESELLAALHSGAGIVGINNRDLRNFEVSLDTTRRLLPLIPPHVVTVSESGIRDTSDRETMSALGVDALLVGEGLLTSPDLEAATRRMCGAVAPALVAAR
ncbi:MAG: indole-3-glycerol phosphate synthase TrpC [Chloroflexota bacterium]|nr:indole-3-glycerol phosphate synthase TrpC [Chloroflexota bacterium]